jgi:hypothetical protein
MHLRLQPVLIPAFALAIILGLSRPAQAQFVFRTFLGSAPIGCDPGAALLGGLAIGKNTGHTEIAVGGVTNGCGDTPAELWPFASLFLHGSPEIAGNATRIGVVLNLDLNPYALQRTIKNETSGEKYLFFRPGFAVDYAVLGFGGVYKDSRGRTLHNYLLFVGGEIGSFSGHGAYSILRVTIGHNR